MGLGRVDPVSKQAVNIIETLVDIALVTAIITHECMIWHGSMMRITSDILGMDFDLCMQSVLAFFDY